MEITGKEGHIERRRVMNYDCSMSVFVKELC